MRIQDYIGKRFHNKAGYTIWVDYDELYDSYSIHVSHNKDIKNIPSWGVYSGFKEDHVVSYCVENFDKYMKSIKDKTARRYFLKLTRLLTMHDKMFSDFINKNNCVDWNMVREYENKYNNEE